MRSPCAAPRLYTYILQVRKKRRPPLKKAQNRNQLLFFSPSQNVDFRKDEIEIRRKHCRGSVRPGFRRSVTGIGERERAHAQHGACDRQARARGGGTQHGTQHGVDGRLSGHLAIVCLRPVDRRKQVRRIRGIAISRDLAEAVSLCVQVNFHVRAFAFRAPGTAVHVHTPARPTCARGT